MKKLFLYDLQTMFRRLMGPLVLLVCDTVFFLFIELLRPAVSSGWMETLWNLCEGISLAAFVVITIVFLVLIVIDSWRMMYDGLFSQRAYLIRTLPVSRRQILFAQFFATVLWLAAFSVLVCVLFLILVTLAAGEDFAIVSHYFFREGIWWIALGMSVQSLYAWMCGVAAMLLSAKPGRQSLARMILYGIGLYYGGQVLLLLPALPLSSMMDPAQLAFGLTAPYPGTALSAPIQFFRIVMGSISGWYVVLIGCALWYAAWRLQKGVDVS